MTFLEPFAFGKLPAHGDFVVRGLGPAQRQAWDSWASNSLSAAGHALGEAFDALFDVAPPWRFVFGPGPFGHGWRAGALAPSIDRAGRRFPIILGAEGKAEPDGVYPLELAEQVALVLENQIYHAFESRGDIDVLIASAQDGLVALRAESQMGSEGRFWTLGGSHHPSQTIFANQPPANLLTTVLRCREVPI